MKTYGQIAFEQYAQTVGGIAQDGTQIPAWDKLNPTICQGWEDCAAAVLNEKDRRELERLKKKAFAIMEG